MLKQKALIASWFFLLLPATSGGWEVYSFSVLTPQISALFISFLSLFIFLNSKANRKSSEFQGEISRFGIGTPLLILWVLLPIATMILREDLKYQRLLSLFVVFIFLMALHKCSFKEISRSIIFVSLIVTVLGFVSVLFGLMPRTFSSGYSYNLLGYRFIGILGHPNAYGMLALLGLFFSLNEKRALPLYRGVLITGLMLSENRSAIFGGLLAYGILSGYRVCSRSIKGEKRTFRETRQIILLFLMTPILLIYVVGRSRSGSSDSTTGRVKIWQECIPYISNYDHIVFGYGSDFFSQLFGQSQFSSLVAFHCHNQFIDDWLNFGFIYACLGVLILSIIFYRGMVLRNEQLIAFSPVVFSIMLVEAPSRMFSTIANVWFAVLIIAIFRESEKLYKRMRFVTSLTTNVP